MKTKLILTLLLITSVARADLVVDDNGRALNNGEDIGLIESAVEKGTVTPAEAIVALHARHVAAKAARDAALTEAAATVAKNAPAVVELEKELAAQVATGPGPKSEVLAAVKAKADAAAAGAKKAEAAKRLAAAQKEFDDLP